MQKPIVVYLLCCDVVFLNVKQRMKFERKGNKLITAPLCQTKTLIQMSERVENIVFHWTNKISLIFIQLISE